MPDGHRNIIHGKGVAGRESDVSAVYTFTNICSNVFAAISLEYYNA
jgi:hypothetical protein